MIALHFAHLMNNMSKAVKTKPMKADERKSMTASFVFVREAAMRIISLVGLRGRTISTSELVQDLRTISLVGRLTQLFVVKVLEEVFVDGGADE